MTVTQETTDFVYYLHKAGEFFELRQTRFRAQFAEGVDHPHDVCATAHSKEEMRSMVASCKITDPIDWDSCE